MFSASKERIVGRIKKNENKNSLHPFLLYKTIYSYSIKLYILQNHKQYIELVRHNHLAMSNSNYAISNYYTIFNDAECGKGKCATVQVLGLNTIGAGEHFLKSHEYIFE